MRESSKPGAARDKQGKQVLLMGTCLCDVFFPEVARATVEILEQLGCEVLFPEDQTCCGQPAFNSGDFETSRAVARHAAGVFRGELPIVVPSGSCAAMHRHGNGVQFEGEPDLGAMVELGGRTRELFEFLSEDLGVSEWPGRVEKRVAIHDACHTRGSGTVAAMRQLLESIEGLSVVEFGQRDQCCGFGGTFSVTFPHISGEMGTLKLEQILACEPDVLVSSDMSCLMHLKGLAEMKGQEIEVRHGVELLREALSNVTLHPDAASPR